MEHDNETIIVDPSKLLNSEDSRLNAAIRALDKAEADYAQNVTNHPWVTSGTNSEAIRAELDSKFRPILEEARENALKAAETIAANARAVVNQTSKAELTLSDTDMAKANTRREFIREDCENLPLSALVDAVKYALTVNDKPGLFLYIRYASQRLKAGDRTASGEWGDSTDPRGREELSRLIGTASDLLRDTSLVPLHKQAIDLSIRASDLRNRIERPRMDARTYAFQSQGEVSW